MRLIIILFFKLFSSLSSIKLSEILNPKKFILSFIFVSFNWFKKYSIVKVPVNGLI